MLTIRPDTFLYAIRKNDNQTILELLGAQPSLAVARDKNGASAIFLALYRGNKEAAREIGQRKRVLDAFEAAAIGDLNQLRTIVDKDSSNVSSYSQDGLTALALASYLGQKGSVEYLIEKARTRML